MFLVFFLYHFFKLLRYFISLYYYSKTENDKVENLTRIKKIHETSRAPLYELSNGEKYELNDL